MAKLIQTVNTVEQTVDTGDYISLGVINRRFNNVNCNNHQVFEYNGTNTISINYPGYYEISVYEDVSSPSAVEVGVLIDGVPYTSLYDGISTTPETISKSFIVRVYPNSNMNISLQNNGTGELTVYQSSISVIKIV